jgi:hypothetical protein
MITIKAAELTGVALDWAVAKCEEKTDKGVDDITWMPFLVAHFQPSTDWAQGGPIIEREEIEITIKPSNSKYNGQEIIAHIYPETAKSGKTYLEAAMRCYVASKFGAEIEIPNELIGE